MRDFGAQFFKNTRNVSLKGNPKRRVVYYFSSDPMIPDKREPDFFYLTQQGPRVVLAFACSTYIVLQIYEIASFYILKRLFLF